MLITKLGNIIGFSLIILYNYGEKVTLNISCLVVFTSNSACSCSACEMTWNLQRKIENEIPAKLCNTQPLHQELGLKIHGT